MIIWKSEVTNLLYLKPAILLDYISEVRKKTLSNLSHSVTFLNVFEHLLCILMILLNMRVPAWLLGHLYTSKSCLVRFT